MVTFFAFHAYEEQEKNLKAPNIEKCIFFIEA